MSRPGLAPPNGKKKMKAKEDAAAVQAPEQRQDDSQMETFSDNEEIIGAVGGMTVENAGKKAGKKAGKMAGRQSEREHEYDGREFGDFDDRNDAFSDIGATTPRTTKKWTPAREQQLCNLWEEETHLYDTTSRNYRNSMMRNQAYRRIATALGMEGM